MAERDGLLAFSRWHARLARARRLVDLDELLASPNAQVLVPAMPARDLYHLVKRVGLSDCLDLLALCHPRQVQTFVDLDAWKRDRLDLDRFQEWLEALLALPADAFSKMLHGLDPEVWVIFLKARVRIHDHTLETMDALGDRVAVESPDHLYLIEVLDPGTPASELALRFLLHLFKVETPDTWRKLLESVRIEISAEVEEEAYRFRKGRLEDLGFVDPVDALEIYAYRDPEGARRGTPRQALPPAPIEDAEEMRLPAPYAAPLAADSFLSRVLALVNDDERLDHLTRQIVALANRALAADGVDIGEDEQVAESVGRMRNYLSMALEYLGDEDPDRALVHLLARPLRELFQIGFSLTLQLKYRADRLAHEGWLSRRGAGPERLDAPLRELVAGLRRRRPVLYAGLTDPKRIDHRDFETLADVALARERLEDVEWIGWLMLDALELDPLSVPPQATFATLLRGAFVQQALGAGFRFDPVTLAELERFRQLGLATRPEARDELRLFLDGRTMARGREGRARVRRIVEAWIDALADEIGGIPPGQRIDPRFVAGLWIVG